MGKQYKPKPRTGAEYVNCAKEFYHYASFIIDKLPEEFKSLFSVSMSINYMTESAGKIKNSALRGNAVYVGEKDSYRLAAALKERDSILSASILEFDVFESSLDDIMRRIDLMKSERVRLDSIFCQIIREYGFEPTKPGWKNYPADIETVLDGSTGRPLIEIHEHVTDIEYESMGGKAMLKLNITAKQRDHLLLLEGKARDEISKRISADRAIIKNLEKKAT